MFSGSEMKIARSEERQSKRVAASDVILSAAVEIVLNKGAGALSMSAIAKQAGISRTSLYEYFTSKEDLVADLLLDELKIWGEFLENSIDSESSPEKKIEGWLDGTIGYMKSGHHQLMRQLSAIGAPEFRVLEIRNAHQKLTRPLLSSLRDLNISHPERVASYIQGLLDTAVRRIDSGNDPELETEYAHILTRAIISL